MRRFISSSPCRLLVFLLSSSWSPSRYIVVFDVKSSDIKSHFLLTSLRRWKPTKRNFLFSRIWKRTRTRKRVCTLPSRVAVWTSSVVRKQTRPLTTKTITNSAVTICGATTWMLQIITFKIPRKRFVIWGLADEGYCPNINFSTDQVNSSGHSPTSNSGKGINLLFTWKY